MNKRFCLLVIISILLGYSCMRAIVHEKRERVKPQPVERVEPQPVERVESKETPDLKSEEPTRQEPEAEMVSPDVERMEPNMGKKKIQKIEGNSFAKIKDDDLEELSGIVSASRSGEYWGHNDKGNDPILYRFSRKGKLLQKVEIENVGDGDWEALSGDSKGVIYIGDVGDNDAERQIYRIHRLEEPDRKSEKTDRARTYSFVYPDGKSHNCESLFLLNGKHYLITKVNDDKKERDRTTIYCIDRLEEGKMVTAREVGVCRIEGQVTDAAYSLDAKVLAVLTYERLYFYRVAREADLLAEAFHSVKIDFDQCEGLCFDGGDLVLTNEEGEIWEYPLDELID